MIFVYNFSVKNYRLSQKCVSVLYYTSYETRVVKVKCILIIVMTIPTFRNDQETH